MSRVFLLACNTATEPYPVYPLGMSVVAAGLVAAGHTVRQYDLMASQGGEAALHQAIRDFAPDVVGMSLRNIDNVDSFAGEEHWYLGRAKSLAEAVRQATNAPVVLGGPAFSIMPEAILAFLGADYGISGAGEAAMPALLEKLNKGEARPGVYTAHELAGAASCCAAPRPAYDGGILDYYIGESGLANLQTKRGCCFNCSYCTYPALEGRRFTPKPAEEVAEDVLWLHKEHGVRELFFTDSVFNDPAGHWLEVAEALVRAGSTMKWSAFFRPKDLRKDDLDLMRRSGCMALELGSDACAGATLAGLNKGFDFDEIVRSDAAARQAGLPAAHFVMFAGPGETPETIEESVRNLTRLEKSVVFAFSGIRILPGTALLQHALEEGVLAPGDDLLRPVYYFSPHVDREALNKRLMEAFQGNRLRLFPPGEAQLRMDVMRRFGHKGLLWNKLLESRAPRGKARK